MEFDPDSSLFTARYDLFQVLINHFNVICCLYPQVFAISIARLSSYRDRRRIVKIYTKKSEVLEFFQQERDSFVVVISEQLEDTSGLELLAELKKQARAPLCLLLLTHNHQVITQEAKDLGADAICLESSLTTGEINFAVESLLNGKTHFDSQLVCASKQKRVINEELNQREVQILRLVAEGKTNGEIGQELHLASSTVREYLQTIMRKLHARDRTSAAIAGLRQGYLV